MSRVKNADRDLLNLKLDDEDSISDIGSTDAAVYCSDAIRLLPAGEVCGDGGVWSDSIPISPEAEDSGHVGIHCAGIIISTII